MNKLNKKGFTLIEMLVVIAIIAVLVSIVVPVVGNSTAKAAAAANAANLRSVAAEAAIKYMENLDKITLPADGKYTASNGTITLVKAGADGKGAVTIAAPASKAVKGIENLTENGNTNMDIIIANGSVTAQYGSNTIEKFADAADNGKLDKTYE